MSRDYSEDMKLSENKESGSILAMDKQVPFDMAAAVSLKNVLFFFSLVFRYPSEDVYEELGRILPQFEDFLNAYASEAPELPEVVELQAEHIRLFVNGHGGVPAVPYASCYLNGGMLKGESYHELCQIMEKTGFVLDESVGELEDHLAVLLEFGSVLTDRLIEASASGGAPLEEMIGVFREVISRYLRPLVKAVLAGVSKCATMDFYSVSAWALYNFLTDAEKIYAHVFGVSAVAVRKRGVKK